MLSLLLPQEEYILTPQSGCEPATADNEGRPGIPFQLAAPPSPLQGQGSVAAAVTHKEKMTVYERQIVDRASLHRAILNALPATIKSTVLEANAGTPLRNWSVYAIVQRLRDLYGTPKVEDTHTLLEKLQARYDPTQPLPRFLDEMVETHRALEELKDGISDRQKTFILKQALQHCPQYKSFFDMFQMAHPTRETYTFSALCTGLRTFQPEPTAASHEYAAAVMQPAPEKVAPATKPPFQHGQRLTKKPRKREYQYCWTHGICFHSSAACEARDPGHDENATFQDRRGGASLGPQKRG
jgi:hypothetical protein